jgi:predicted Kef-type K+ transport protein
MLFDPQHPGDAAAAGAGTCLIIIVGKSVAAFAIVLAFGYGRWRRP